MASGAACAQQLSNRIKVKPNHAAAPFAQSYVDLVVQNDRLVHLNDVSGWKHGKMWSETEGEWRRIQFRTMESPAQEVAGALGLRIATRPGAKVEKIIEIKWMDERKDGPNGADIGGPDVQELWVMDSFAFAFSMKWSERKIINRELKSIKTIDYASRTEIVIKIAIVSLVNFLYDKNKVVPFVPW